MDYECRRESTNDLPLGHVQERTTAFSEEPLAAALPVNDDLNEQIIQIIGLGSNAL
jgi:hypothetical protein